MLPERMAFAREQRVEKTRPRGSHSPTQTSRNFRPRSPTSPTSDWPGSKNNAGFQAGWQAAGPGKGGNGVQTHSASNGEKRDLSCAWAVEGLDVGSWFKEAADFEVNTDFKITSEQLGRELKLEALVCANRWTPKALSDKLSRHRIISNLGIPQMPVHYLVEGTSVDRAEVGKFVMKHLCGPQSRPVAIKPTHLSNGVGVIFVGRVAPEDGPQPTVNYLVHHMNKYLAQSAAASHDDFLLKPGFMVQEKYESVLGFDRPLELRVFVLWGRARLASWWSHGAKSGEQPIVTLVRCLATSDDVDPSDEWTVLQGNVGREPMYCKALEVLQQELPAIAAAAQTVSMKVGSPFLRADFFVGSERWGIRLNEVACGDAADSNLFEMGDSIPIAQIIQDGHALCQQRYPPEHFLSRLGVQGSCYKDMVIADVCYSDSVVAGTITSENAALRQSGNEISVYTQETEATDDAVKRSSVQDSRTKAEQSSFQEFPAPRSSKKHDYRLGDEVEVWSKSQGMWCRGKVQKIGISTVSVSFTLPDGMLYAKELPPGHRDLRKVTATNPDESVVNDNTWKVGDEIEVWSNSRKLWGQGKIERVAARDGDQVVLARFTMPDGSICEKEMWASSSELRRPVARGEAIDTAPTPSVAGEVVTARPLNAVSSPEPPASERVDVKSVSDFAEFAAVYPILGTQFKLEAQKENAQPPNAAPNTSAVQRSPSYVRVHATSPQGLQQLSAPHGQATVAPRTGSYVPKAILLTQDGRSCMQASQEASPVPRSYSYVPPPAESLTRHQPTLSAASPVNQTYVPSCATSPTPQTSGFVRVSTKLGVQGGLQAQAQARAASVPPQRVGAPQTNRSFAAPPWAGGAVAHPATASSPSAALAKARSVHSLLAGGTLHVDDIAVAPGFPNPMSQPLRSQILARLGVSPDAAIRKMAACGGQNDGVWLLEASGISCVLKLVRNLQLGIELPTETEKFSKLAAACPDILFDDALTFPMRIFRLRSQMTNPTFDLLVMPMAPGERLSDVISIRWALKKRAEVMDIMERAGRFLKDFHVRYSHMQHCDFQPSNLFYDDARRKFTLVDLADLGQQALITEKDVDRFLNGLRIIGKSLGPEFMETLRHFQVGYNSG